MVALNFPTVGLQANVTKHQIGTKSWVWNGSAWDKDDHGHSGGDVVTSVCGNTGDVVDVVCSFNGRTGAVIGVDSVCGYTGEVVDVVCSFNGLTGAVTGVGSFDGLTGSVLARNILPHIHLAGVSADGGATFGGYVVGLTGATFAGTVFAHNFFVPEDGNMGIGTNTTRLFFDEVGGKVVLKGSEFFDVQQYIRHVNNEGTNIRFDGDSIYLKSTSYNNVIQAHKDLCTIYPRSHIIGGISANAGATFDGTVIVAGNNVQALGLTLGNRGITFEDGTGLSTAPPTDAYSGHIEAVVDKTYIIDPSVASDRTITGFYIKSDSGTVTATLKNANDTVKAASVAHDSGDQSSLSNTAVSAGATMSIVTSSNSAALDVVFNIEYTG